MAVETVEIQERCTKKAVRALKQEESELALYLKAMREKLEALVGEIKDDREQRKQWVARRETGKRGPSGHGANKVYTGPRCRICTECDCAMLKKRRGRREPLHQYIVGVPIERLAMDMAWPYPITLTGNQYCLMVVCYSRNGLSDSQSWTRRPLRSLGSWYARLWPDMEHSESYIAIRAQISGQRWCWRCVDCSGYTRQGLHRTTRGATGS